MTRTGQHKRRITALALGAMLAAAAIGVQSAQAQTYTVLHRFGESATDGVSPHAGLIGDSAGNLYGTTGAGGASDSGVVFKLDKTGTETELYSFTGGADGAGTEAGLIQD